MKVLNLYVQFDMHFEIEKLEAMGFVLEHDGTGDPRGADWNIRNENFHLWVDAWCDVFLARVNPDTDQIKLDIDDYSDLQSAIDWISD